jgi:outer membrane lipoprotein-sorting protein
MQILERTQEDAASKAKALEALAKDYQDMEKTITYFGKKKQRYLRQMARRQAMKRSK